MEDDTKYWKLFHWSWIADNSWIIQIVEGYTTNMCKINKKILYGIYWEKNVMRNEIIKRENNWLFEFKKFIRRIDFEQIPPQNHVRIYIDKIRKFEVSL